MTANIQWAEHLTEPELPPDEELLEQERERRREWQARRFDELREKLRR